MTTNAEKRVLIAQDVVKQLDAEIIVSNPQSYLVLPRENDTGLTVDKDTQVQDILKAQKKPCKVCALGACFVSMLQRYNDLTVSEIGISEWMQPVDDDLKHYSHVVDNLGNVNSNVMPYLERLFDKDQLLAIEVAYEGFNLSGSINDSNGADNLDLIVRAHEFHMEGAKYDCETEHYWAEIDDYLVCGEEESRKDNGNTILRDIMKNIIENKGEFKP